MADKPLIELDKIEKSLYLTDKEISHHYLSDYDHLFSPLRDRPVNIFEIGYWYGGSCELWKRYFPYATIRAIDVVRPNDYKAGNNDMIIREFIEPEGRVSLEILNSLNLTPEYFKDFIPDIAIDDGCHRLKWQLHNIKVIYPILKKGGMLIVEDVTGFPAVQGSINKLKFPYEVFDKRKHTKYNDSVFLLFRK